MSLRDAWRKLLPDMLCRVLAVKLTEAAVFNSVSEGKVFAASLNSPLLLSRSRLKIVDDDIDWKQMVREEEEIEEDEEEAPVVRTC